MKLLAIAVTVPPTLAGHFMICCRETAKMGVPPGNRAAGLVSVPERYVVGTDTRDAISTVAAGDSRDIRASSRCSSEEQATEGSPA